MNASMMAASNAATLVVVFSRRTIWLSFLMEPDRSMPSICQCPEDSTSWDVRRCSVGEYGVLEWKTRRLSVRLNRGSVARQPGLDDPGGDLSAGSEAKFTEEIADMGLDRPLADEEVLGNLAV